MSRAVVLTFCRECPKAATAGAYESVYRVVTIASSSEGGRVILFATKEILSLEASQYIFC